MLNHDGSFSFADELMALVDAFVADYERAEGALSGDLERGLAISYVLGAMLCDLELIWEAQSSSATFGRVDPRAIFDECARRNADRAEARREIERALIERGWITVSMDDAQEADHRSEAG